MSLTHYVNINFSALQLVQTVDEKIQAVGKLKAYLGTHFAAINQPDSPLRLEHLDEFLDKRGYTGELVVDDLPPITGKPLTADERSQWYEELAPPPAYLGEALSSVISDDEITGFLNAYKGTVISCNLTDKQEREVQSLGFSTIVSPGVGLGLY